MLQDISDYYETIPCIRETPSGLLCKKRIPAFLNRLVASSVDLLKEKRKKVIQ